MELQGLGLGLLVLELETRVLRNWQQASVEMWEMRKVRKDCLRKEELAWKEPKDSEEQQQAPTIQ